MGEPCTNRVRMSDPMTVGPCPDCQHTWLVHPGYINPSLTECVLCALVAIRLPEFKMEETEQERARRMTYGGKKLPMRLERIDADVPTKWGSDVDD